MKRILSNAYILSLIKKSNTIFFGIVFTALISRYLGAENKGVYSYVLSILNISVTVFNLGLNQSYPYYKRKNEEKYLFQFIKLSLILFILYLIVGIIFYLITSNILITLIISITAIGVLNLQFFQYTLVEEFKKHNISYILSNIIQFILLIFIVFGTESNVFLALIAYISKEVFFIVQSLALFIRKYSLKTLFTVSSVDFFEIVKFGIIPMYVTVLTSINYQIDTIMLTYFNISFSLIGLYSSGLALSQYGWLIPDIFKDVMINKTAKKDDIENLTFSLRLSSTILIIVYLVLILFGKLIIRILFGNEFLDSYPITIIIFLGVYSMIYSKLIGTLYIAKGKLRFYALIFTFSVILNFICNVLLIPRFNIYGAALSTVLSYAVSGSLFLVYFMKDYKIKVRHLMFITVDDLKLVKTKLLFFLKR